MKKFRRIFALVIGTVFFIAAVFKLIDPVGTSLIVRGYYNFLGISFLDFSSRVVGVALGLLEAVVGAALITGVWRRQTAIASGVMTAAFTVITFVLWVSDTEMECGCFGEAIHLTQFQTFLKNIALCVLWVLAFVPLSSLEKPRKVKYATFALVCLSVGVLTFFSLVGLPLRDYTPFAPGAILYEAAEEDFENAPVLSLSDAEGNYHDEEAIAPRVMAVSVYYPERLSRKAWDDIFAFADNAAAEGFSPVVLVSGTPERMAGILGGRVSRVRYGDWKSVITLNRSNGGVTYLASGKVIRKWAAVRRPSPDTLKSVMKKDPTDVMADGTSRGQVFLQAFLLYVFAVMLLI